LGDKGMDRRAHLVLAGFALALAALTARLFYLQIIQHDRLAQMAQRQQERTVEVQPARGNILDRCGRPLAFNRECFSYFAVPSEIQNPGQTARLLAPWVGVSARTLEQKFKTAREFVWLRRKVSDAAAAGLEALALPGVHRLTESRRVYPEGTLACHVLGFVGVDNQGLDGVELQFERLIHGTTGWMRIARDAQGRAVLTSTKTLKAPEAGQDVALTIDKVVQHMAERELAAAVQKYQAASGSVLVMDPRSGEILALANWPQFDPNRFWEFSGEARRNRAVRDLYEPGSTFKLFTAAAALEEGVFSENDMFDCEQGSAVFGSRVVRDHIPHGLLSLRDVISLSSNIGAVKIGQRLGAERLVRYARGFGFGHATGVELPGEASGLLKAAGRWNAATMASVPYGQEVAVTTLQTAAGYAAVANDGWLPQPTLIKEIRTTDGQVTSLDRPEVRQQAVSPDTARRLRALLLNVVAHGTGTEAQIPGYEVAGKTGTAQKSLRNGRGYDLNRHVASFVGFLPADNPRLLIAVVIDSPHDVSWGGVVSGPVFKALGQNLVAYLGISPAQPTVAVAAGRPGAPAAYVPADTLSVPDIVGGERRAVQEQLRRQGLGAVCYGRGGQVMSQRPAPGAQVKPGSPVVLYFDPESDPASGAAPVSVVVPNVAGQSLRNALQLLGVYGLRAQVKGSGLVAAQSPAPNVPVALGSVCSLTCLDPEVHP
jgi:cell division protein FtsI (penicillin-binding protein 3)